MLQAYTCLQKLPKENRVALAQDHITSGAESVVILWCQYTIFDVIFWIGTYKCPDPSLRVRHSIPLQSRAADSVPCPWPWTRQSTDVLSATGMHMLTKAPMATPQKIVLLWHSTTSHPELTQLRYYGVRDI